MRERECVRERGRERERERVRERESERERVCVREREREGRKKFHLLKRFCLKCEEEK